MPWEELTTKYARKTIDRTQRSVTRAAALQYRKLDGKQKAEVKLRDIEAAIYPRVPGYPGSINYWIHEVAEIACKSVDRREKFLARPR